MTAPLAARIQAYLRNEVTRARDVEVVGPFLATFSQGDSNPFRNYAIPDDGARPTAAGASRASSTCPPWHPRSRRR
jgi:hypothetical protein